jgi:hypothetical protein
MQDHATRLVGLEGLVVTGVDQAGELSQAGFDGDLESRATTLSGRIYVDAPPEEVPA